LHFTRRALQSASRAPSARAAEPLGARLGLARALLKRPGMEILSLALAAGFFALSWALVALCERLLD
jgi:hypothetical protein